MPRPAPRSCSRAAARSAPSEVLGTVGIIFLIACANVANLFIARAESRRLDLAVRLAMGASRAGLIRSLMSEALLLSAAGGVGGILLAWASVPLLVAAAPEGVPNIDLVALNPLSLLVTLAVLSAMFSVGVLWPVERLDAFALRG